MDLKLTLRFVRAVAVRSVLKEAREADCGQTHHERLMRILNVDSQELDNILQVVLELDAEFGTYLHSQDVVNRRTGLPGKGFQKALQQIAEAKASGGEDAA